MPLAHVTLDGKTYTPEELLDFLATRPGRTQWTYELAKSILAQQQDREARISTTSLTAKCLRSNAMERALPFTNSLERMYAAFRGTLYHGQLEQHYAPGSIAEARYHALLPNGDPLSGSPDLVDISRGILYDYKTTKSVPRFDRMWEDHALQLQINRWLVDNAHEVEFEGKTYNLRTGRGAAANRDRFVPIDWQELVIVYLDNDGPKTIPVWKSIVVPTKDGKGTKKARTADIWTDEQALEVIEEQYARTKEAMKFVTAAREDGDIDLGLLPPVPVGFTHQAHVLCNYCPVRLECRTYDELERGVSSV